MHLKLQRTNRVSHSLEIVGLSMGKVVHGIYVPFRTRAMVRVFDDTIHDGVSEMHVGRSHVDFGPQHETPLFKFAFVHTLKQVEILFNTTVAIRALDTRLRGSTLLAGNLLRRLFIDIGFSLLNHANGQIPQFGEIVRGIIEAVAPVKTQPVNILHDGVDILDIFLHRIGVVETQVTRSAKFLGNTEVNANSFGMTDVQITVGFGRETGAQPASILSGLQVGFHNLFYEIETLLVFSFVLGFNLCHKSAYL